MRRLILAALAASALAGCPAAHNGYPDKSCMLDSDCYKNEMCDAKSSQCVPASGGGAVDSGTGPSTDMLSDDGGAS